LSVAGRVGRAVRRNRWKRAIREAFRLHRHKLPAAYDIVISVEWNSSEVHMGRVEESFLAIVEALRRNERHRSAPGQQG
jgi:ribonuclease P protein component